MVIGPALNRLQDISLVSERPIRAVPCSISDKMGIASGIGQVVFPVVLMHPGCFKEPPIIVSCFD